MKKKTALILLLVISLVTLTACGSSGASSSSQTEPKKQEEPAPRPQYPTAKFDGTEYEFDEANKHYDMSFRYSNDWKISGYNETMNLYHGSEENPDFVVTLIDYAGQKITDAVAALSDGAETLEKEINGTTWTSFDIRAEQKTSSLYMTEKGNDLYLVVFQSDKDTTDLQKVFMEYVAF